MKFASLSDCPSWMNSVRTLSLARDPKQLFLWNFGKEFQIEPFEIDLHLGCAFDCAVTHSHIQIAKACPTSYTLNYSRTFVTARAPHTSCAQRSALNVLRYRPYATRRLGSERAARKVNKTLRA